MEIAQNRPWLPPDTSHLQFQDCEVVANWSLGFFTSADLPVWATTVLLKDGLEEFWRKNNITHPNYTELIPWVMESGDPIYIHALNYTNSHCQDEFCRKLPWAGNADLAGRGMVANYCILAGMVTIYMAFHMAARFGWSPPRRTKAHRILVAIQESTRPFLDSTLLFSIAVHIATLFTFIRGRIYPDSPTPTTTAVSSVYIALYTIFAPLTLHCCAADHLRRKQGRKYIWIFIATIKLTVCGLYFSEPQSPWLRDWQDWNDITTYQGANEVGLYGLMRSDPDHQLKWESFCVLEDGAERANWSITIASAAVSFTVGTFLVFISNIFRLDFLSDKRRPFLRKARHYRWVIFALLGFQAMWASLGIFFWFRNELNDQAGQDNKDREWTFGQILAVTSWAPVLMEFYVVWRDGAEQGLTGLLSDRYSVVEKDYTHVQQKTDDIESPSAHGGEGQEKRRLVSDMADDQEQSRKSTSSTSDSRERTQSIRSDSSTDVDR